jgi:CheY-like chemotaxis protein
MSGGVNRTSVTPSRRFRPRSPRLGGDEPGGADRPQRARTGRKSEPTPGPGEHTSQGRGAEGRRSTASPGLVLIVDDEHAIRLVCRVNLANAGFETLEAADGNEALALARSERPDLILLDIMLPGLDGWRIAEELAADEETRDIPIVFLSARSEVSDVRRSLDLGGVGYIRKPFDAASLPDVVAHTMERVERGERDDVRREWLEDLGE